MGGRKGYLEEANSEALLREKIRTVMSSMQTDTDKVEDVISKFESKLDDITSRLESLEDRVSRLEKKLDL